MRMVDIIEVNSSNAFVDITTSRTRPGTGNSHASISHSSVDSTNEDGKYESNRHRGGVSSNTTLSSKTQVFNPYKRDNRVTAASDFIDLTITANKKQSKHFAEPDAIFDSSSSWSSSSSSAFMCSSGSREGKDDSKLHNNDVLSVGDDIGDKEEEATGISATIQSNNSSGNNISHKTAQITPHPHPSLEQRKDMPPLASFSALSKRKIPIIDPSLYKPPSHQNDKPDPIVHELNIHNRPMPNRQMMPVTSLFKRPISNFWSQKWHSFNHFQTEVSQALVNSDDNIVVSAPTGAGKTCIFEMAIGRLFQEELKKRMQNVNCDHDVTLPNCHKIVYLSPSKALCQERFQDWSNRLKQVDPLIQCTMITGDSSQYSSIISDIASAHIIITTPEKWDSITRKWTDSLFIIGSVKLLLIDEIHLIGDSSRGACLETIICRMKTVQRAASAQEAQHRQSISSREEKENQLSRSSSLASKLRMVAVSATLPNISDIASFLDAHKAYSFDSSFRPVPLTTHVIGLGNIGKNQFLFDKGLNRHIPDLIRRFSDGKPSIIFCHTKKQTESLAMELTSSLGCSNNDATLANTAQRVSNMTSLQCCIRKGIAFHHGGLEIENRTLVEQAFSQGLIQCLCATSTLAMGINLPAHLVVIKGTSVWRGTAQGYQDIDAGTLLQMIGRAGRTGFDNSGTAIIMTDAKSKQRYERMSDGLNVVESMLLQELTETLNSEISQKVITDITQAIDWLKGTFFYVRVKKNAKHYRLHWKNEDDLECYLMERCVECLKKLHEFKMIDLDDKGIKIEPRQASQVMSRHMVQFDSMKAIVSLPHDVEQVQLLHTLSIMNGIQFPVRRSEKSSLNKAHKEIKYKLEGPPSKVKIQTPSQKAFVLLQAAIGQYYLDDYTLRQEMSMSVEFASRMLSAIEDYSIEDSRNGKVALEALMLRRNLATSLWGTTDYVLNQLRGVGVKTAAKLAISGIRTFEDIFSTSMSSNEIEVRCCRKSPFGQELKNAVSKLMKNSLKLSVTLDSSVRPNELVCHLTNRLTCSENKSNQDGVGDDSRIVTYTLSVHTDRPGGSLAFRTELSGPSLHRIKCPSKFGRIYVKLVSNLIGLDDQAYLEGTEAMERVTFLSPRSAQKANTKGLRKSENMSRNHNQPTKQLAGMVNGVHDFRMFKQNPLESNKSASQHSTPTSTKRYIQRHTLETQHSSSTENEAQFVTPSTQPPLTEQDRNEQVVEKTNFVTPSPSFFLHHPKHPMIHEYNTQPLLLKQNRNEQFRRERTIRDPKRSKLQNGSWKIQKKQQQQFQQRAFGSPKENPFSKFQFDPNNVEGQLEIESKNTVQKNLATESVIPSYLNRTFKQSFGPQFDRRSKFQIQSKEIGASNSTSPVGSARRGRVGIPYQLRQHQLLHQKAAEQQAYVSQRYDLFGHSRHGYNQNPTLYLNNCSNSVHSQSIAHDPGLLNGHSVLYENANERINNDFFQSRPHPFPTSILDSYADQIDVQEAPLEQAYYVNTEPGSHIYPLHSQFQMTLPESSHDQHQFWNTDNDMDCVNMESKYYNINMNHQHQVNSQQELNGQCQFWSPDPNINPKSHSCYGQTHLYQESEPDGRLGNNHFNHASKSHSVNTMNQKSGSMEGMVIRVNDTPYHENRIDHDTFESAFF